MMSPTPAVRRFEPPSTLMHCTLFAPLLSATSRFVCIWIIVLDPSYQNDRVRPREPTHPRRPCPRLSTSSALKSERTLQCAPSRPRETHRSAEHTSALQSLMRHSYAVF